MTEGNGTGPQLITGTSAAKSRRGRPEAPGTAEIRGLVDELQGRFKRMTVRQIFYAAEVAELSRRPRPATTACNGCLRGCAARRPELVVHRGRHWFRRMVAQWDDLADYIDSFEDGYRRNLWRDQGVRLEVWLEKDALAEVVLETTARWRVPLMVSRGQSSLTFLHAAAMDARGAYRRHKTRTWIYALYDHDAGGDRAARAVAKDLPGFALVPIHFERLAVTADQIEEWDLPTRPAKDTDPEAETWGEKPCVELDAIPVDLLHELVEGAITRHVDDDSGRSRRRSRLRSDPVCGGSVKAWTTTETRTNERVRLGCYMRCMRQEVIEVESYRPLAEHLPRGKSFRQLAEELGHSHEYWWRRCHQDSAEIVDRVEEVMRRGKVPLFEIPPQPLQDWQAALTLSEFIVAQLRQRGWLVMARGVRIRGADPAGVGIEIVYVEESEEEQQ